MTLSLATLVDAPALGPRPFLTWYGADGERVEISATVTANWVAKTVNLLVEEYDAGPGTLVRLDLPPHWRTAVWALATWRVGAGVVLGGGTPADLVVTDRPHEVEDGRDSQDADNRDAKNRVEGRPAEGRQVQPGHAGRGRAELVVQVLPALARHYDGELPAGAMDAAQAIGTYSDVIGYVPAPDPAATAVVGAVQVDAAQVDAAVTTHAELGTWAAAIPPATRLAVTAGTRDAGDQDAADVDQFLRTVLGALRAGTSLVFLPASHPDPDRILATEHAAAHP